MLVKNLADVLKVVQGGIEEYFGLHVVLDPSNRLNTALEKGLGFPLTSAEFVMHSPTGKAVMGVNVSWTFKIQEEGNIFTPSPRRPDCGLTSETELYDLQITVRLGHGHEQDDFLCYLRPHVKKAFPKVNVLLSAR
jgi:hypothetical protein